MLVEGEGARRAQKRRATVAHPEAEITVDEGKRGATHNLSIDSADRLGEMDEEVSGFSIFVSGAVAKSSKLQEQEDIKMRMRVKEEAMSVMLQVQEKKRKQYEILMLESKVTDRY